jgi:hypothetical protein
LLAVTTVVVGRGCGLLKLLLAPLPPTMCALPSILGGVVG